MSSKFQEVGPGVKLNYTIHEPTTTPPKPRPWIILISGLGDTQGTWFNQVPAFTAAGYTVLTFDNRGVGLSTRLTTSGEPWTINMLAADVRSLVKTVPVPAPYHALGQSMGGMIAQRYALDLVAEGNEAELASVTASCTFAAVAPYSSRVLSVISRIATSISVAEANRVASLWCWTPEFYAKPENQPFLDEMDRDLERMDDNKEQIDLASFLAQINAANGFDIREELMCSSLGSKVKVIVIAGERDTLIPVELSHSLHTIIKGSRWRPVKGGHVCKLEFPNEYNKTCLEAWKEVEEETWILYDHRDCRHNASS